MDTPQPRPQATGQPIPAVEDVTALVPADAGEWAAGLEALLRRIPAGWGRTISCDAGWYPLLCRLDAAMAAVSPGYVVHQVKEKFGGLRFYFDDHPRVVSDPADPGPEDATDEGAYLSWTERREAYAASPAGVARQAEADARLEALEALVREAEAEAARTCEQCGAPGELRRTLSASPWVKTVCPSCAGDRYVTRAEWDAWWVIEQPRHEQRLRDAFVRACQGKKLLVACADTGARLCAPADYATDPDSAAALLEAADYDEVWLADDEVGQAVVSWLALRFSGHDPARSPLKGGPGGLRARILLPPPGAPVVYVMSGDLDMTPLRDLAFRRGGAPRYAFLASEGGDEAPSSSAPPF